MTGFPGRDRAEFFSGWYEENTESIATIRLSVTDEGIVTLSTDTPSSKVFESRIQNAESFSIRRQPIVWPHGDTSVQMAAFGQLQIDNVDGLYSFLVGADLRDAPIEIKLAPAMAFGTATLIADSPVMATGIFENATSNEDTITISIKDSLSSLDRPLPVRYNPPFVDAGAANRMVPISLGAVRNVAPLLVDGPNRIYQIGDGPLTNVAAARDGGAPLDPHATPPQYIPAISGSGIQLETDPVYKFTIDASSVGQQVIIPTPDDVLAGDGVFDTWTGSPSHPTNWTWTNHSGSLIMRVGSAQGYPIDNMAYLGSARPWYPFGGKFGDSLVTDSNVLTAGKAYRLTAHIFQTFTAIPSLTTGNKGGIRIRTALSDLAADDISGLLTVPIFGRQAYVWEFRCDPTTDRPIYIIACAADGPTGGTAVGLGGGIVYDLFLEELGEYVELPLTGIGLEQFFYEWLVNRAGLDEEAYEAYDLSALDVSTGYEFGYHVTEQPNILDGLRTVLDSYCATLFTDHLGTIRVNRLADPKDGISIADFDETNIIRPISIQADNAENLTTVIGAARNWDPLGDTDFVTDYDVVPAAVRTRFKQTSQYQRTSSKSPAGQYSAAIGAPVFNSLIDDPDDAQTEIDRVVGIWSPRVYNDATFSTGKRRIATFTARYDDVTRVGATDFCDVRDLTYGAVVTLNYAQSGFDNTAATVIGWELFPFMNQITLTVFY